MVHHIEARQTAVSFRFAKARPPASPLSPRAPHAAKDRWPPRSATMARWSSGQDEGLSRLNREFDSPTGHQKHRGVRRPVLYASLAQW